MPLIDDTTRLLQGLDQRGEFDAILLPLRLHAELLSGKLKSLLAKQLVKERLDLAEFQYLQGQLRACLDLAKQYKELSTVEPQGPRRARPSVA